MNTTAPGSEDPGASTRNYGATAGFLTAVLAASGILTYAFFVLASHALSADDYGALVVLWSSVFIIVSISFRPVELLLARTVSEHEARDEAIGPTLRIAAAIQLVVAVLFVGLALAFRGPIEDQLLDGRETLYLIMLGSVLMFSGAYFGRGLLAGRRRFGLFAALLLLDSAGRLLFAVVVALGVADGVNLVALGVLIGPLLSLIVVPMGLKRRRVGDAEKTSTSGESTTLTLSLGAALAASLFVALLCEQVLLTTGALFVRGDAGTAAAGFMFNIMLVARAPVMLFQAVAASLLPHLTRLRSTGDESSDESFRLSVRLTIEVVVGFSAVVIAAVLALGPFVMGIAFGDDFDYDRLGLGCVAVGLGFYLAASTLNQAAIARGRVRAAAACWVTPAVLFVLWNVAGPLETFRTAEVGFAGASAVLWLSLLLLYRREPASEAAVSYESARLDATLAAADELL